MINTKNEDTSSNPTKINKNGTIITSIPLNTRTKKEGAPGFYRKCGASALQLYREGRDINYRILFDDKIHGRIYFINIPANVILAFGLIESELLPPAVMKARLRHRTPKRRAVLVQYPKFSFYDTHFRSTYDALLERKFFAPMKNAQNDQEPPKKHNAWESLNRGTHTIEDNRHKTVTPTTKQKKSVEETTTWQIQQASSALPEEDSYSPRESSRYSSPHSANSKAAEP